MPVNLESAIKVFNEYFPLIEGARKGLIYFKHYWNLINGRLQNPQKNIETDDEKWARQSGKYALHEIVPGKFAYVSNPPVDSKEPRHYVCSNCFGVHRISILHAYYSDNKIAGYRCPSCGMAVVLPFNQAPIRSGKPPSFWSA